MTSNAAEDVFDRVEAKSRKDNNDALASSPENKKSSWKSRLKGKIFANGGNKPDAGDSEADKDPRAALRVNVTTQKDIQDFLHSSGQNDNPSFIKKVLAPRIDVAASSDLDGANEKFVYHKPRRKEGLNVNFIETLPEIIGRGGDETTDPVAYISRPAAQTVRVDLTQAPAAYSNETSLEQEEDNVQLRPLRRAPTGFVTPQIGDDARRLSFETDSNYESSPNSSNRPSQFNSPENTPIPSQTHLTHFSNFQKPNSIPVIEQTNENVHYGPPSQHESDSRQNVRTRDHQQQPQQQGPYLSIPSNRYRPGYSPSPAGRTMPNASTGNEGKQSTSPVLLDSPESPFQQFSRDASMYTNLSSLSLSSRGSNRDDTIKDSLTESTHVDTALASEQSEEIWKSPKTQPSPATQEQLDWSQQARNESESNLTSKKNIQSESRPSEADTYGEFVRRISHTRQIFELISQRDTASQKPSSTAIFRAALYWFVLARLGLEDFVRDFGRSSQYGVMAQPDYPPHAMVKLLQHHVNLAKVWWLSTQINDTRNQAESNLQSDNQVDNGLQRDVNFLHSHFQNLTRSMAKRDLLPPEDLLVKGAETSVWLRYPKFPPQLGWIIQNSAAGTAGDRSGSIIHPLAAIPLGNTQTTSCSNTFVIRCRTFTAQEEEGGALPYPQESKVSEDETFPCLAFVLHRSTDREISLRISSLTSQVNILIREQNRFGPSWEHVRWEGHEAALRIKLPNRFRIRAQFQQRDFGKLAAQYSNVATLPEMSPRQDVPPQNTSLYRATALTPGAVVPPPLPPAPSVSQAQPQINEPNAPTQTILPRTTSLPTASTASPTNSQDTTHLVHGSQTPQARPLSYRGRQLKLLRLEYLTCDVQAASRVTLFEMDRPEAELLALDIDETSPGGKDASTSLRLLYNGCVFIEQLYNDDASCSFRLTSDLSSGEFSIQLLRPFQLKFRVERLPSQNLDNSFLNRFQAFADKINNSSVISRWTFPSIEDLHSFQSILANIDVKFDSLVKAFSMSRRLPMVPVSKTYEANDVRVQLVNHYGGVQLLCFFSKYSLANVLQFPLKSSDNVEVFEHKGKDTSVRLGDAKFDLPSDDIKKRVEGEFISMEKEYPIDHEDVVFEFHDEAERDRFLDALPAQATHSRKFSLRRRI